LRLFSFGGYELALPTSVLVLFGAYDSYPMRVQPARNEYNACCLLRAEKKMARYSNCDREHAGLEKVPIRKCRFQQSVRGLKHPMRIKFHNEMNEKSEKQPETWLDGA